ncbi:MAG: hypothetical protein ABSH41_01645 [Syntrophobacteraceae bacterium]
MNQLLHWVERKTLRPSVAEAAGHPSYREYALIDLLKAGMIARFLALMSLKEIEALLPEFVNVTCLSNPKPMSLWDALRGPDRERYRYFFQIEYHRVIPNKLGVEAGVEQRWGFCAGLHEILGLAVSNPPIHISRSTTVDVLEVLETLERRTGDVI